MKKHFLYLITIIVFYSCGSDSLSHRKAENIIEKCFEENPVEKGMVLKRNFFHGGTFTSSRENINFRYRDKGLVELIKDGKSESVGGQKYDVFVTDKGLEYQMPFTNTKVTKVHLYSIGLDKVIEIHENPSNNTAEVEVQLRRFDISPFQEADDEMYNEKYPNRDDRWEKILNTTYLFKKTSNGWVLERCERLWRPR
jgi:hypothetical protein